MALPFSLLALTFLSTQTLCQTDTTRPVSTLSARQSTAAAPASRTSPAQSPSGTSQASRASSGGSNPFSTLRQVTDTNFADPCIWHDRPSNTWYSFATRNDTVNIQVATSTNWDDWSIHDGEDALPNLPDWVAKKSAKVWAPDIILNENNEYVMYYSASPQKKPDQHCVGAAKSRSIGGPYVPEPDAMFCDVDIGGAIDASGFTDSDGQRYVVYKVDGNSIGHGGSCGNMVEPIVSTPIMLQAVEGDGIIKKGIEIQVLDRDHGDGPLIEAPNIVRTEDGKYVLFFSSGCYMGSTYDISYAMADKVTGPYRKYGPLAITGTAGLYAPGGASMSVDGQHMLFHANQSAGNRPLYVAQVSIDTGSHVVSFH